MKTLAHSDRRKVVNPIRENLGTIQDNKPSVSPVVKLWPSGDVSLWYPSEYEIADRSWQPAKGLCEDSVGGLPEVALRVVEPSAPLTSSEVSKSHSEAPAPPNARGMNGLTSYGRKMVGSGVALLEDRYGSRNLTFCTVTIPPLPVQEARLVFSQWSELVREMLQYLGRQLSRAGQAPSVVSVSEVQTSRGLEHGQPYLHLHLVWGNRRLGAGHWPVDVVSLRGWVSAWLGRKTGLSNLSPRIETALVKKSARAYLAKYLSKGSEAIALLVSELGEDCVPSTWWNMTANLRAAVKASVIRSGAGGRYLNDVIPLIRGPEGIRGDGVSLGPIYLGEPGQSPVLGYSGRVWGRFEADLREVCLAGAGGLQPGLKLRLSAI